MPYKKILSNSLCECGCGLFTNLNRKTGKPYRYIHNHYRPNKYSLKAIEKCAEARKLKIDWQEVAKLYQATNLTFIDIAKKFNCSGSAVRRNLKKIGIGFRGFKGFYINKQGYVVNTFTNLLQHREIIEKELGRKLDTSEHVHHKNGIKNDNRLENLKVFKKSEHHKEWASLLKENIRLRKEIENLKMGIIYEHVILESNWVQNRESCT